MTDPIMTETPVTQADRDAAADFFLAAGWHGKGGTIKTGDRDDDPLVQAFARHRTSSTASSVEGWEKALLDGFYLGPWVVYDETDEVFLSDGAWREDLWEARTHSRDTAEELALKHGGAEHPEIRAWPSARFDNPTEWRLLEENAKLRASLANTPAASSVGADEANRDRITVARRIASTVMKSRGLSRDNGKQYTIALDAALAALAASSHPASAMDTLQRLGQEYDGASAGDEGLTVTYADLLEAHERILTVEMELVRAQRALKPFAEKATKWEENHPGIGRDSAQVQHRLADFRAAREECGRIDRTLEGLIEKPFAYCCAEGGGAVEHCDCVNKNWGTAWVRALSATPAQEGEGERCQKCGHGNPSWSAPSPLWNAVMRGGSIDGEPLFNDMVCASCFMELAEQAGIASNWRVDAQQVNVLLETTTPSGRVWDADQWLWVHPDEAPKAQEVDETERRALRDRVQRARDTAGTHYTTLKNETADKVIAALSTDKGEASRG